MESIDCTSKLQNINNSTDLICNQVSDQDCNEEKSLNSTNGLNKIAQNMNNFNKINGTKNVPLILKRNRLINEKDYLETNENIDDNKKSKKYIDEDLSSSKELGQRSSQRKKIKKSFGSDFLDLDVAQYSRYINKKPRNKNCFYCNNDGNLLQCKFCRLKGHLDCFQNNLGGIREGYKNLVVICSDCRNCEVCSNTKEELFFCKKCNSVFHKKCEPNIMKITKPIFGEWQCSYCDTLDFLAGDSLTEEQRKREINRRKLIAMRKRFRKSNYIVDSKYLDDKEYKDLIKKNKINLDSDQEMSLHSIDKNNEIDLSEDILENSKYVLFEDHFLDLWLKNDSMANIKFEDILKKERKINNFLSKEIKEDKIFYSLVKIFIDLLVDSKFTSKKNSFLKILNSDSYKKSFFETATKKSLLKGSIFLKEISKFFEKFMQDEFWVLYDKEIDKECFDEFKKSIPINLENQNEKHIDLKNEDKDKKILDDNVSVDENTIEQNLEDEKSLNMALEINEDAKAKNFSSEEPNLELVDSLDYSIEMKKEDLKMSNISYDNQTDKDDYKNKESDDQNSNSSENQKSTTDSNEEIKDVENQITDQQESNLIEQKKENSEESKNNSEIEKPTEIINEKPKDFIEFDKSSESEIENKSENSIDKTTEIPIQNNKNIQNNMEDDSQTSEFLENQKLNKNNTQTEKKNLVSNKDLKKRTNFKIKSTNSLVEKLFKRACKYNLNLLEPKFWTAEDVAIYLKQIGYEEIAQLFKNHNIDGEKLLKLTRQEVLKNFGIKLGPAIKIYAYIYDLQIKNKCNIAFN